MINASSAWERIKGYPMFSKMRLSDFRPITFGLLFTPASGVTLGPTRRDFPGGAIILGISAGAVANAVAFNATGTNARTAFALEFSYTADEQITPGGPIMAEALCGGGDETQFPPREIVVPPTAGINTRVQNLTITTLTVHIAFHCLVWRFSS